MIKPSEALLQPRGVPRVPTGSLQPVEVVWETFCPLAWHPCLFGKHSQNSLQRADGTAKLFIVGGGLKGDDRIGTLNGEWLGVGAGGAV